MILINSETEAILKNYKLIKEKYVNDTDVKKVTIQ